MLEAKNIDTFYGKAQALFDISVHVKPSEFTCHRCGEVFALDLKSVVKVTCPKCESTDCSLSGGSEFYIRDMEAV